MKHLFVILLLAVTGFPALANDVSYGNCYSTDGMRVGKVTLVCGAMMTETIPGRIKTGNIMTSVFFNEEWEGKASPKRLPNGFFYLYDRPISQVPEHKRTMTSFCPDWEVCY